MELSREEADSAICKAALVTMSHVEEKESRFFFFSVVFSYGQMEFTRLLELAIRTILAGILVKSEPSNIYCIPSL